MNALLNSAWDAECDEPSDKLVLVNLADHANTKGNAWPHLKTVARETGLSPRTIAYALSRLETRGHLSVSRKAGCSHRYNVHPVTGALTTAAIAAPQPLQQTTA